VVNNTIKRKQCTIIWHLDDLRILQMEKE